MTAAERDLLARMPDEFTALEGEDGGALWSLERRGFIDGRVRPTELATLTEMEWRISAEGVRARGGFAGNG
ncbi:hypothetical protein [Salinarimonas soli]|uniref:Uncharacterized protein n=1 Tax=Salinarimonas soli TaxID=1638099 RepID=A0A5B2V5J3_9HYPH|nr:hypothetical protein [Salinarimonas soli]KAA2234793.1 hypothetical protein F0L46_22860 [Salinarimonas soli]